MKHTTAKAARTATTGAALFAAISSFAGIKYWDNPGFKPYDVGDYVQDGLQVNYDGIRNAALENRTTQPPQTGSTAPPPAVHTT